MKTLILLFLLMCSMGAVAQSKTPSGAWIPVHAQWKRAPAEIEPNLSTLTGYVLFFQADGKVIILGCDVYRQSGHYAIGVGPTIFFGKWSEKHGQILIRTRFFDSPIPKIGKGLADPWRTDLVIPEDGDLLFRGVLYHRFPELDKDAATFMPHNISPD